MPEHVDSPKVKDQIKKDGFDIGRKAIEEATKKLTDRGFDRSDVLPLIKEGVQKATQEKA